jgi:putative Mn2+ efflux pump MntP
LFGAIIGAICLLYLYKLFLDRTIKMKQGLLYATLTGIISSILPIVGIYYDSSFESPWISSALLFSVFAIWQPLFSWTVRKAKQPLTLQYQNVG